MPNRSKPAEQHEDEEQVNVPSPESQPSIAPQHESSDAQPSSNSQQPNDDPEVATATDPASAEPQMVDPTPDAEHTMTRALAPDADVDDSHVNPVREVPNPHGSDEPVAQFNPNVALYPIVDGRVVFPKTED